MEWLRAWCELDSVFRRLQLSQLVVPYFFVRLIKSLDATSVFLKVSTRSYFCPAIFFFSVLLRLLFFIVYILRPYHATSFSSLFGCLIKTGPRSGVLIFCRYRLAWSVDMGCSPLSSPSWLLTSSSMFVGSFSAFEDAFKVGRRLLAATIISYTSCVRAMLIFFGRWSGDSVKLSTRT